MYCLFLAVDTPQSSGVDEKFLKGPLAALARFEGDAADVHAPEWTRALTVGWPLLFRQPRGAMAEVFSVLLFWHENRIVKNWPTDFADWAAATAVGTPAELKEFVPLAPNVTPNRPTRTPDQNAPHRGRSERRRAQAASVDTSPCSNRGGRRIL